MTVYRRGVGVSGTPPLVNLNASDGRLAPSKQPRYTFSRSLSGPARGQSDLEQIRSLVPAWIQTPDGLVP